jgi:ADP-ribose pyrophosphatase YjhB (NUDIX family)
MSQRRFKLISAVHVFLIQEGSVLLLRRTNTGYADGLYSVVAGHLNGNETIKDAARREALEEVGVYIRASDLELVAVMHRKSEDERVDWFLKAERWEGSIVNREPEKCDQLAWFPLDDLPDDVIPYVGRAVENVRHGRWFESYGWV